MNPAGRPRPLGTVPPAVAAALVVGSYLAVRTGATEVADREIERRLTSVRHRRGDHVLVVATDLGSTFGLAGTDDRTGDRRPHGPGAEQQQPHRQRDQAMAAQTCHRCRQVARRR